MQRLLERHGHNVCIADPSELEYRDGELSRRGERVDLVYNRLVDFSLDQPDHAVLRAAYLDGAVVVTPTPHIHALFAAKRRSEERRVGKECVCTVRSRLSAYH